MATSLLKRGEKAIVIFTYGKYFKKHHDGSGSTGNWVIDENRNVTRVVIYNRTEYGNEVYVAKRKAITPSKHAGRFIIELDDIEYYGCTYFNWPQFSGSRNPVRYFNKNRSATPNTIRSTRSSLPDDCSAIQHSFS